MEPQPVGRVPEPELGVRVGEPERAAGTRVPEGAIARPERKERRRLEEPQRERGLDA